MPAPNVPLVGRDRDLGALVETVRAARTGHGTATFAVGVAAHRAASRAVFEQFAAEVFPRF